MADAADAEQKSMRAAVSKPLPKAVAAKPQAAVTGSRDSYWELSRRPLVSLAFVAPIVITYELGVLTLGPDALRNAADVWGRQFLRSLGFGQYFLLPLLVCGVLLGWHHIRRDPWQIRGRVVAIMWLESLVLGVALLVLAQAMGRILSPAFLAGTETRSTWSKFIGYLGAGFYEELLFRLLLLSGIALVARRTGLNRRGSLLAAVVISSVLFAAVHYRFELLLFGWSIGPQYGDRFTWYSCLFRIAAGLFFGCLFVARGFGIVVGAHAAYDVLVLATE
jgi:membrane protease YdiL (CAAX protease family)